MSVWVVVDLTATSPEQWAALRTAAERAHKREAPRNELGIKTRVDGTLAYVKIPGYNKRRAARLARLPGVREVHDEREQRAFAAAMPYEDWNVPPEAVT